MPAQLDTHIQYLKGVGPKLASLLALRGIKDYQSLIDYLPRKYIRVVQDLHKEELFPGDLIETQAYFVGKNSRRISNGRTITTFSFKNSNFNFKAVFFKLPFRGFLSQLEPAQTVTLKSKIKKISLHSIELHHPEIQFFSEQAELEEQKPTTSENQKVDKADLMAIYPEIYNLSSDKISKMISGALKELENSIPETLPDFVMNQYKLPGLEACYRHLHLKDLPENPVKGLQTNNSIFHKRLKYEELFWFQVRIFLQKKLNTKKKVTPLLRASKRIPAALENLPFQLTQDQQNVIQEIIDDFKKPLAMHRLIQGDVGSGKTLVAFVSALHVIDNGGQTALMAPTEILAEQHYKKAKEFFEPLGLTVAFLSGSQKKPEYDKNLALIYSGKAAFAVGTHALFQKNVFFNCLKLAIIDEQHRFGVKQREALHSKGKEAHFLVMTATPIPRTLSMTLYGDLDISIIREKPPGRMPILTKALFQKEKKRAFETALEELQKGHQIYWIFPLIEESEKLELKSIETESPEIIKFFKGFNVGILHGKLKAVDKEKIMLDFRDKKYDILLSTTVVEVGVDVPNATTMIIEHAERFGLSQLHQLRGRVGRGTLEGFCFLMLGKEVSQVSIQRSQIMEKSDDGFYLAEEDLKLRGAGDLYGTKQSGLPEFKFVNLIEDQKIIEFARKDAEKFVSLVQSKRIKLNQELEPIKKIKMWSLIG